jgi:predicted transcriptional regulator
VSPRRLPAARKGRLHEQSGQEAEGTGTLRLLGLHREGLSPAEWQLMRICRRLGRCTVREVSREGLEAHIRDYRTILTFMTRMAKKGWLEVEIHQFLDQVVGTESENRKLVKRILDGHWARELMWLETESS